MVRPRLVKLDNCALCDTLCHMSSIKTSETVNEVVAAIGKAAASIGPVGKSGKAAAQMGGYQYRGIDDVVNSVSPVLVQMGLVIIPKDLETTNEPFRDKWLMTHLRIAFRIYHVSGEWLETEICATAGDGGDKGLGKARSYALRELLTRMFLIPTSDDTELTDFGGTR